MSDRAPGIEQTVTTYHERIAKPRELVLAVVHRLPGLTAAQIERELEDVAGIARWGYLGPYNDLRWLERRGLIERVRVSSRTILWRPPFDPAEAGKGRS